MGLGIRTLEQRITAGGNFDGTLPAGTIANADNIDSWPAESVGGLFPVAIIEPSAPVFVRSLELFLSDQTAWTVHKKDANADELLIVCGTTEEAFLTTESDSFILTANQSLVVRTTGATGAMICRIHLQSSV